MAAPQIARRIYTIINAQPGWSLEHAGAILDTFKTREEAMASATRRANASQNSGHPAQIRFADEPYLTGG
jgi:hypothetical protein